MIERVWFKNFRALRDVAVGLSQLTVFVGPNGSGKTSVLEGVHYLLRFAREDANDLVMRPGVGVAPTAGTTGTMELGAAGHWDGDAGSLVVSEGYVTDSATRQLTMTPERVVTALWAGKEVRIDPLKESLHRNPSVGRWRIAIGAPLFLRLSARKLAAPSYLEEEVPSVRPDGEGLASVLNDLQSSAPEAMAVIEESLRAVVPSVRRVRTVRAPVHRVETEHIKIDSEVLPRIKEREYWGHRVVLDTASGDGIPVQVASEGTVLTLGLLTVLHGRNPPRLLLLDDIDRALHPKAQEDLVAQIRKILAARPDLQIVATSHSPYLLDTLQFEEVRLTTLRDDGSVACAPLTAHPEYERWKDMVKPGELWTSAAESWVAARAEPAP